MKQTSKHGQIELVIQAKVLFISSHSLQNLSDVYSVKLIKTIPFKILLIFLVRFSVSHLI